MKDTAMRFNRCQTAALATYCNGDFDYLVHHTPQALLRREIQRCGDTLVAFMLQELSNENDCTSPDEGVRRLTNAAQSLLEVAQHLRAIDNLPTDANMRRVTWTIDVVASDPRSAALEALAIQRNASSIATAFEVLDPGTGRTERVDLGLTPLSPGELRAVLRGAIE